MMLGEVTPGGAGSGLYTILLFAIIAVFIGGLMIGRTPEYLGKKIQAREVKLAGLGVARDAARRAHPHRHRRSRCTPGRAGTARTPGPHGFTEILYALHLPGATTTARRSRGLSGNTAFYNIIGGIDMLLGRFAIMVPVLALGGIARRQERRARSRSARSAPTTPCSSACSSA